MSWLSGAARKNIRDKYRMSPTAYADLLDEQNGACAICGSADEGRNPDGSPRRLGVDHDHSTGDIRGLLCVNCNLVLAHAKDRPETLQRAIDYLTRAPRLAYRSLLPVQPENATKTHCKHGHAFDATNTYLRHRSKGTERVCRRCKAANKHR